MDGPTFFRNEVLRTKHKSPSEDFPLPKECAAIQSLVENNHFGSALSKRKESSDEDDNGRREPDTYEDAPSNDIDLDTVILQEAGMTAAQQVLSTWELLEDILLRAPTKTILMSQRVAQSWRDVIQASHNLQRALFLEPIPGERGNLRIKTQVSQLGLCDVRFTWTSRKGTFCSCGAVEKCVAFNSLLEHVFTLSGSLFRNSKWAREMPKRGIPINSSDIEGFYHIDTPKENPAMRYPEASWRKMFLTQPPCFRVGPISTSPRQSLRCSQYPFNQGLGLVDLTTHESGVTMGHLRDALL